ncbi:helix-turn-helix transcriptional regulator [Metabacillus herbersteinensis]|uniref:Helix-turn-helix transcriptional regulator n=1 Tax=Metabacillus herbersteinensis TaxID=283816 RepID=A0ABV6GIU8_9BACI
MRSPVGRFIDKHRITQRDLEEMSGVNRNTISNVCNMRTYTPNMKNAKKIIKALRKIDSNVDYDNFW